MVRVSVIMACKNSNLELLSASIQSILCQTFKDFEIIIVIDDSSEVDIERFVHSVFSDNRIKLIHMPPAGLGAALNYGIENSIGEYIARLDDDDLMARQRLEVQVKYLDEHPEVSCVGSQRYSYNNGKYIRHRKFPLEHDKIVKSILSLQWPFAHTALMFRRTSCKEIGGYRIKGCGEDVDFVLQLGLVGKLANIDDYLLYYYLGMKSLSTKNNVNQLNGHLFALEDVKNKRRFGEFIDIINKSIIIINQSLNDSKSKLAWKRWLLIKYINIFGKKLPELL